MSYPLDEDSGLPPHLLKLFLRSAPLQVAQLADACVARDVERARGVAHTLKGSLYAAGASRLATSVEALRTELARADFSSVERQLRDVREDFAALVRALEQQLQEPVA